MTLSELAAEIGAELVDAPAAGGPAAGSASGGPPSDAGGRIVRACNVLEAAGEGDVSFLSNPKYAKHLATTRATAVIVAAATASAGVEVSPGTVLLKTTDPYYAWTLAVVRLHGHRRHPHRGVHPAAHVDPSAQIGEGTVIYPGAYVGPGTRVGRDCIIYANAAVYDECVLGDRVIVHANASIGPDGFGFATHKDPDGVWRHHKIPQVGNVVLEDDVEVGSNTSIARAAIGSTVIGQGTKVDNQVAIGHGVRVGPHCLLVAQVGIAGSTTLGHHVTAAGQVGIAGHLKIGNAVTMAAQTGVGFDIEDQATIMGRPSMPIGRARRVFSLYTQLPEIVARIKQLEQDVGELSDAGEPAGDADGGRVRAEPDAPTGDGDVGNRAASS